MDKKTKIEDLNGILYPLSTEKSMRLIESENKLVFVVDRRLNKSSIKSLIEKTYGIKISRVNTLINRDGKKVAFVTLSEDSSALDVATDLGIM